MVKDKKTKKSTGDESDKEVTVPDSNAGEDAVDESESDVEVKPVREVEKKPKRKEKKSKKKESDSDDDEAGMIAPARSAFALLAVDDGDSDSDNPPPPEEDDDDDDYVQPVKAKPKQGAQEKGGKKGKKSKKKRDDDEEDIDKVLAELEMEYSGQKPEATIEDKEAEDKAAAKKAKKKERRRERDLSAEPMETDQANGEEPQVKSLNQKKKEKKKEKKREKKEDTPEDAPEAGEEEDDDKAGKKKKKSKADKEKDLKGPGKKTIAAMQEALKKIKEEEERMRQEEEDRIKREEEEETRRLEQVRLEKERKEKKKQKEKERKERLKAEGKLLTAKQKQDKLRAQELVEYLKAKGLELPEPGEKKVRPGTRVRPNKGKSQHPADTSRETSVDATPSETDGSADQQVQQQIQVEIVDQQPVLEEPKSEDVKDAWDAESSGEDEKDGKEEPSDFSENAQPSKEVKVASPVKAAPAPLEAKPASVEEVASKEESDDSSGEEDDDDEEDDDSSNESDSDEEEEDHRTEAEKKRDKALARIKKRKEDAEKTRTLDNLRAAVVCVLGHVDTGKTKILDKLRQTNVQVSEAGGITQQIGATNVPMQNIKDNCKLVKGFAEMELKLPGLLIIDTPGHESFSNLRSRGSSLCDIAILVVDIMHGLEPQTIESLNLLKARKTPFIVALNKIDRLYNWQTMGRKDIRDIVKAQAENTQTEFKQRTKEVEVQFAEQGLNAALFYESPDLRSYVSLVPTSAITGEGMGNLLALIVEFCQTMLAKRLMYSELLQATVLEVKMIPGLGTTIDCILINGKLREGDTIILAGTDGPVVTQIRSLLMPQPMKELRVKNAYIEYKEIKAAQGVKIAGKDLEKSIAGLNLMVAEKPDEVEIYCDEVAKELKGALSQIKLKDRGVYVQASTLGSLEALLEFLKTSKIPVSGIRIGPVVKKDVMKASIMLEHESQYATILAFDVKVERDAQEAADSVGVKIFQADIIYHLFDRFMAYREELKAKKREEFKNIAVFPCRLRVLPNCVFNSRDPIVVGVMVEAGVVKEGTPICVPSKEFLDVGLVTSVEQNHKPVEQARKGMEVCIKIENIPGETPKLFGRHFDHTDILTSKISRQSIDACKDYFREDLTKADWQLMVELKKLFQIM